MEFKDFDIKTHDSNIKNAYANNFNQFVIPFYQRNITWDEEQCKDLVSDIEDSINYAVSHYIGDITIVDKDEDVISVTDGQQRLTGLMLLSLAAISVLKKYGKKYQDEIKLFERMAYTQNGFKVVPNRDDLTVLEAIVKDNPNALESLNEDLRKDHKIENNYNYFKGFIEKYINKGKDPGILYEAIINMQVTVVYCDLENAQIVYANKNSKGKPLTHVELIKNRLFSMLPAKKHKEYFEKYWLAMERLVFPRNLESFFMDAMIVISRMKGIKDIHWHLNNRLLQNMTKFISLMPDKLSQEKKAKIILDELLRYAKLHNEYFNFNGKYNMAGKDPLKNRFYEYETLFKGNKNNSIMLYLLDMYTRGTIAKEPLIKAMEAFVTAQVRAKYTGQYKGAQRQVAPGLLDKIKDKIEAGQANNLAGIVWDALAEIPGTNGIPRDNAVISYITENPLGLSGFANIINQNAVAGRYLLYRINVVANDNGPMPEFRANNCSIEHIIPPNNKSVWKKEQNTSSENKMAQITGQFGNLALVEKPCNSNYFAEKAPVYRKSVFPLTQEIGKNKKYTKTEVVKQTKKYAELFCKAFPVPEKYQTMPEDEEN